MVGGRVSRLSVRDVRFPTSLGGHGSDAMHTDPDYSAAYVILETDAEDGLGGHGITSTLGKGTEVELQPFVCAVNALAHHMLNKDLEDIVGDFRGFYRQLTSDGQLRWPLWKLLVDMDARALLSCIDFRYITNVLTERKPRNTADRSRWSKRERRANTNAWLPCLHHVVRLAGYSDDTLKQLGTEALKGGWTRFKVKVGADLQDDIRRCRLIRNMIGPEKTLMMDANQCWDVPEAVEWMATLAEFKPLGTEEPISPDDMLGHATISKALIPFGIGVATGEQAKALQFLQIDSCRLGSVHENLSMLLMAKKFEIPEGRTKGIPTNLQALRDEKKRVRPEPLCTVTAQEVCEYVDHLHEHSKYPVIIKNASYMPPKEAGYSAEMEESVTKHQYPDGDAWKKLLTAQGN